MIGRTHLTTGVTSAAWLAYALPLPDDGIRVMVGTFGAFCALAPDIDHLQSRASKGTPDAKYLSRFVRSFGGHRTWTHDARIGPPVFALAVALATFFLAGPIGRSWWAFALAMGLGCLTHIWGDARTVSGVPLGRNRVHIGRVFSTDSDHEHRLRTLVYRPFAAVSVVAVTWLTFVHGG